MKSMLKDCLKNIVGGSAPIYIDSSIEHKLAQEVVTLATGMTLEHTGNGNFIFTHAHQTETYLDPLIISGKVSKNSPPFFIHTAINTNMALEISFERGLLHVKGIRSLMYNVI